MFDLAFNARDTFDALQQTNGIDDQLFVGRCPCQGDLASRYMCLKAKLAELGPEPLLHGVMDPRQHQFINERAAAMLGLLESRALSQTHDLLDAFGDWNASGIEDDGVK